MSEGTTRREFLFRVGGAAIAVALLPVASSCDDHNVVPLVTGGQIPFLTAPDDFYVKNGAEVSIADWTMPDLRPADWTLTIDGLVGSPQTIRYSQILASLDDNGVDVLKTLRCIIDDNDVAGLIGTAVWRGVPLRLFLNQANPDRDRGKRLRLYGADGFTNNLLLETLYADYADTELVEPLLVTHLNGSPLPREHGSPVRLVVHDGFGYMNVKWLERVEVTDDDSVFGTYQDAGFVDQGQIRVVSRVTRPLAGVHVPAGRVRILGFALSGAAGIDRVEISIDHGGFAPADLIPVAELAAANPAVATSIQATSPELFPYPYRGVWTPWQHDWQATPGTHIIQVRAVDRAGNAQPDEDDDITDGINAAPTIQVTVG